jgi:hypothetical protein
VRIRPKTGNSRLFGREFERLRFYLSASTFNGSAENERRPISEKYNTQSKVLADGAIKKAKAIQMSFEWQLPAKSISQKKMSPKF